MHDVAYCTTFNIALAPPLYYFCGARDIEEIAIGTALSAAFGVINGSPTGYAIDIFRDLAGLEHCERKLYPSLIKRQNSTIKKGIAAALIATTIGLTGLIYSITPDNPQSTTIEQKIDLGE